MLVLVGLVSIVLFLIVVYLLFIKIIKLILFIIKVVIDIFFGDWEVRVLVLGEDELGILVKFFNLMINELWEFNFSLEKKN